MGELHVERWIAAIEQIASRRGGRIDVTLGSRASASSIAESEKQLALSFPPSLRAFLRLHDGFTLRVYSGAIAGCVFERSLEVRCLNDIVVHTKQFREFHAEVYLSNPERVGMNDGDGYVDALDMENPDARLLLRAVEDPEAEGPVLDVDLIGWTVETPVKLADSFSEFVQRALEFMVATEAGFTYWGEPFTDGRTIGSFLR